ncbi:poly-beta-1,6-N-acetyl-D-glucosamine N-deacetylase PgaB [Acinetobacter sp. ANC 4779]|uniref:poly-beta-1,6-N-acetyl-D-glucosamine N-deacetylase PgaB n=1 Tax=Acinetobacter sp. ANC 4779 TaxID=2529848 RepID=UPI00103BE26C|nr:poly-beta-1,6-N-acetyl-D-glucosamine N-deacetylase PgaB [Acinetobacter sp. ANC 4779]TCB52570.1 poly-beta-1,6-N-acetyl-D-glucosamine N-deacetylase PgaB [Acinetobacter sp. ANC 4779]
MINLKKRYKNRFTQCLYLSLGCLPLSANSAHLTQIKHHPIDEIVQQNTVKKSTLSADKTIKIDQMRIMHIDIDYVYDKDKKQQQKNIQNLIERIQQIQPNTIFLQAFADPDANGSVDQVYFKNRHIPLRENLFPRLVKQIRSKTQVQHIYAWLPLMAWEFPKNYNIVYVSHSKGGKQGYIRVSPFDPQNLKYVSEIYLDFIKSNAVDGVLYHDDITLSDYEDSSKKAQNMYQSWGFNSEQLLKQPKHSKQSQLAQFKTAYLDQFAEGISKILKQQQPNILTARNMYAPVVLNPVSENWFSQSMPSTYQYYDYNAIMAMPYMEEADDHQQFYLDLIQQSKKYDPELNRTIFELQAVNWKNNQKLSTQEIIETIKFLEKNGVKHIGYYPDDFVNEHPQPSRLKSAFLIDD